MLQFRGSLVTSGLSKTARTLRPFSSRIKLVTKYPPFWSAARANPSTTRRSSPDCSMPGLQGTVQDQIPRSTANLLQSVMPSA
jgi:hypothetical protein